MTRWLLALLLACSCGPCCPCGDDCDCDAQSPQTSLDTRYYAEQGLFAWSPSGKPYHEAACIVKSSDGKCGSGIYLDYGGMTGVLTCQHVVGSGMSATFSDGKTLSGEARTDKFGHDIAWIAVKHPSIKPLKLSAEAPKAGERVEFVSRGGPLSQLRHWYGKVQSDGERLRVDANITPGDSGGTILNERGEVVGVSTDGATTAARVDGWVVYGGAGSPGYQPIRAFLRRLFTQFCPDGNCPPSYPPRFAPPRERYGDLYPPQDEVPEPPQPRDEPEQPDQSEPPPSDDRIGQLEERLDQLEKAQQGPPGKDGRDGKDGANADPKAVAELLQPQLPTAEQISAILFAQYGDKLAAKVKSQIPPLYVEVVDPTGKYSAPPQAIKFMEGEGLRLILDPTRIIIDPANKGPN